MEYRESEDRSRQWGGGRGESGEVGRESEDQSRQSGARGRPDVDFGPGEDTAQGMDQDPEGQPGGRRTTGASHYEVGSGQQERGAPASVPPRVGLQTQLDGIDYPIRKTELLRQMRQRNAPQALIAALEQLPDQEFHNPGEIQQATGDLY